MPIFTRHVVLFSIVAFAFPVVLAMSGSGAFLAVKFNLMDYTEQSVAMFVAGLLLIVFGSFCMSVILPKRAEATLQINTGLTQLDKTAVNLSWWAILLVSLYLLGPSPGQAIASISALQTKVNDAVAGQSILFLSSTALVTAAFMSGFITFKAEGRLRKSDWARIGVTAFFCFAIGSRYRGIAALAAPVYLLYIYGKVRFRWVALAAVAAMIAVNLLLALRTSAQGAQGSLAGYNFVEQFFSQWSIFDGFPISIVMSQAFPVTVTEGISNALLWALPEAWVGEKSLAANMVARLLLFRDIQGGITLGLYGEAYYYLGIIVALFFFFLIGAALACLNKAARGSGIIAAGSIISVCTFLLGSIRNGLFNDMLSYWTITVTCICLWLSMKALRIVARTIPKADVIRNKARIRN